MAALSDRMKMAAMSGGIPGALGVALADVVRSLRAAVVGQPYARILGKTFTSSPLTLSATTGVTSDFLSNEFKNDGKYPWVLEEVFTITTTGSSDWRLSLKDAETLETFFGSPNRMRVGQIIDANRRPTGMGRIRHEISPNGGIIPTAESVGSADVIELTLKGFWIVEE